MNTTANPQLNENSEIWYSVEVNPSPTSSTVSTSMLDLDTVKDISAETTATVRHVVVDTESSNTSGDIDNIFNFISLTSDELTALNMTSVSYTDAKIFFEFKIDGNFIMKGFPVNRTLYLMHLRPTITNDIITGYTKLYSVADSAAGRNTDYDDIYLEAQAGDLLLLFHIDMDGATSGGERIFTIGQVFSIGANSSPTYLETRFTSITTSRTGTRVVIDTTNSDSQLTNMFRHYSVGATQFQSARILTYNIARFVYNRIAHIPLTSGLEMGSPRTQSLLFANELLGVPVGLTSFSQLTSIPVYYFGVTNIRTATTEYNATLIQDTTVSTHDGGYKYPNNGYSTTLSSSNITDIFDLKELTQAEMRILTGRTSGTFSSTGNMVLEAKISGVMTVQKATTAQTVALGFNVGVWIPEYTNGTLTGRSSRQVLSPEAQIFSQAGAGATEPSVTTITADSDNLWPGSFVTVEEGNLLVIRSVDASSNVGTASAIAINFVQA